MTEFPPRYVAFSGAVRLCAGDLGQTAVAARRATETTGAPATIFDRTTGRVVDLDLRGSEADLAARYAPLPAEAPRRGRPKLGVTAREVTLLPRHWDWLSAQPGGASVALRKLVEAARKADGDASTRRMRQEVAYRFMSTLAGNLPDFEEASRALFAGDLGRLQDLTRSWPGDISTEVLQALTAAPES